MYSVSTVTASPRSGREKVAQGASPEGSEGTRAPSPRSGRKNRAQIPPCSTVYTDDAIGYFNVAEKEFVHETVNHLQEYVRGQVHTNGIENFWSLIKRTLNGTYIAVEPFHLDRYADGQAFRYNNRVTKDNPLNDADRFALLMSQVGGKRLTYAQSTGKDTDSLYHAQAGSGQEEPF